MKMAIKSANLTGRCLGTAASALAIAFAYISPANAQQATFADFPYVIYCEYQGITSAYYFSQLVDGEAIYLTPDRQVGMITIDGVAQRIGGDRPGSCLGKTLDELRSAQQAFDLPR
jgi:hypothetical protein